ncbi:hypothetical protein FO519_002113 [Halicephalobus sp. NKZ332]|nr:hypothetical protein FO519_002113 [Halicephalobus sp. NKZ332]
MHQFGRKQLPVHELICRKNVRLAQTELTKLVKKQKTDILALKVLQVWINISQNKSFPAMRELEELLEALRTSEDDDQLVSIFASAFRFIGRSDKAAEAFSIFLERFDRSPYMEQTFENVIRDLNFDEQCKLAMRMHKTDPILVNKKKLCIATFLQAAFKKTTKERDMGLKFAVMLARKLFKDYPDDFLDDFISSLEPRPLDEKSLLEDFVKMTISEKASLTGFEAVDRVNNKIPFYEKSTSSSTQYDKNLVLLKLTEIASRTDSERDWSVWENLIQCTVDLQKEDPNSDAKQKVAEVFKAKIDEQKLQKDWLLALINFTLVFKDLDLPTADATIVMYIDRFGHFPDTIHHIVPLYLKLNLEEQQKVIDANKRFTDKCGAELKPWISKRSKIGETIPHPNEEEWNKIRKRLSEPEVMKSFSMLAACYYQSLLLGEILKNVKLDESVLSVSEAQRRIDDWIDVIQILDDAGIPKVVDVDALVTEIIRQCSEYFWWMYRTLGNYKYIEALICFLKRQQTRSNTRSQVIQLLLVNCYFELGLPDAATQIFEEMQLRHLQYQSMGYLNDYFLESVGRLDDAYKYYDIMSRRYACFFLEMQDILVMSCFENRVNQSLEIATKIMETKNSFQRAIQYSRKMFLDLILHPRNITELRDSLLRDGWPNELPYDHRDLQIFLQYLPVQQPSFAAYVQAETYCYGMCEISIFRILNEFLVVVGVEHENSKSVERLSNLKSSMEFHLDFVLNKKENSDPSLYSSLNSLRNRVVLPFYNVIIHVVERVIGILKSERTDQDIARLLPSVKYLQQNFDQVESIIYGIFKQKNNYGMRFQALASTIKMSRYLSQLVCEVFQMIASLLKVSANELRSQKKFRQVFDNFRRYGSEIKTLLILVDHFLAKLTTRINQLEKNPIVDSSNGNNQTRSEVRQYFAQRTADLKNTLSILKRYCSLESMSKLGLIEN